MLIPDLERDLVDAAARSGSRRRRRTALVGAGTAACVAFVALLVLVVLNDPGGPGQKPAPAGQSATCDPGKPPPAGTGDWSSFDRRPIQSLTMLGCARLEDGRQLDVIARDYKGPGLCLDLHVAGTHSVLPCAVARHNERKPPTLAMSSLAVAGTPPARLLEGALAVGWARWDVKRVELQNGNTRSDVTLIEVSKVPLVLAAGQHRPFGVFAFKPAKRLPRGQLVAFDARDRPLGLVRLPRALGRD